MTLKVILDTCIIQKHVGKHFLNHSFELSLGDKKFIERPNMKYNTRRNYKTRFNGNNIPYCKLKIPAEEIHTVNNGAIVGILLLLDPWQIEIQVAMYSACRLA